MSEDGKEDNDTPPDGNEDSNDDMLGEFLNWLNSNLQAMLLVDTIDSSEMTSYEDRTHEAVGIPTYAAVDVAAHHTVPPTLFPFDDDGGGDFVEAPRAEDQEVRQSRSRKETFRRILPNVSQSSRCRL